MELLDRYNEAIAAVHAYFGYVEDWRVIPLDDGREHYWYLDGGEAHGATLHYAYSEEELTTEEGNYYEAAVYTYYHLPKWVYRGPEYTMVSIDTQTDGNKFLMVLSNERERPQKKEQP